MFLNRRAYAFIIASGYKQELLCIIESFFKNILKLINSSLSAPSKIEELTAGLDEKTQRSPAGNRTQGLANSGRTDPAVNSSIFVGAEREELICNDPDKSEFTYILKLFWENASAVMTYSVFEVTSSVNICENLHYCLHSQLFISAMSRWSAHENTKIIEAKEQKLE